MMEPALGPTPSLLERKPETVSTTDAHSLLEAFTEDQGPERGDVGLRRDASEQRTPAPPKPGAFREDLASPIRTPLKEQVRDGAKRERCHEAG